MPYVAHRFVEADGFQGGPCGVQTPPSYITSELDQAMQTYGAFETVTCHDVCLGTTDPAQVQPPNVMVVLDPVAASSPPPPPPPAIG